MYNLTLPHNETVDAHNAKVDAHFAAKKKSKPTIKHPNQPVSQAQRELIFNLIKDREVPEDFAGRVKDRMANHTLTMGDAGKAIDWMLTKPKRTLKPIQNVIDGPGVYVGSSGEVYTAAQKEGYKLPTWRRAVIGHNGKPRLVKVNPRIARTDINTGGHKVTEAEADQLGQHFGYTDPTTGLRMSFCVSCGRLLTAEESVNAGIGPICRGKTIWA